ncbi:MAG: reverse transcriptase family protein [Candidatus Obscuribacterales bacterium]|nr:reverse transcriptase family protein [Candidatus Obscuribacterales bacterium]
MISSVDDFASRIGLSEFCLKRLILRSESFYSSFSLPGRSGRRHNISSPATELKTVQRWILKNVLSRFELHEACVEGRSRSTPNADSFVLKASLKSFFATLNRARVEGLFRSLLFPESVAVSLARLTTFLNALPQGAPTSVYIANLICRRLDRRVNGLCGVRNWSYRRDCGDIVICGQGRVTDKVLEQLTQIAREEGFDIEIHKRTSCNGATDGDSKTGPVTGRVSSQGADLSFRRLRRTKSQRRIVGRPARKQSRARSSFASRLPELCGLDRSFTGSARQKRVRAELRLLFNSAVGNSSNTR